MVDAALHGIATPCEEDDEGATMVAAGVELAPTKKSSFATDGWASAVLPVTVTGLPATRPGAEADTVGTTLSITTATSTSAELPWPSSATTRTLCGPFVSNEVLNDAWNA